MSEGITEQLIVPKEPFERSFQAFLDENLNHLKPFLEWKQVQGNPNKFFIAHRKESIYFFILKEKNNQIAIQHRCELKTKKEFKAFIEMNDAIAHIFDVWGQLQKATK